MNEKIGIYERKHKLRGEILKRIKKKSGKSIQEHRLGLLNERFGFVEPSIWLSTPRYTENGFGPLEGQYGISIYYLGFLRRSFKKNGNPLTKKLEHLRSMKDPLIDGICDLLLNNKFNYLESTLDSFAQDEIINLILNRRMTKEKYYGYFNGEIPIFRDNYPGIETLYFIGGKTEEIKRT